MKFGRALLFVFLYLSVGCAASEGGRPQYGWNHMKPPPEGKCIYAENTFVLQLDEVSMNEQQAFMYPDRPPEQRSGVVPVGKRVHVTYPIGAFGKVIIFVNAKDPRTGLLLSAKSQAVDLSDNPDVPFVWTVTAEDFGMSDEDAAELASLEASHDGAGRTSIGINGN